MDPWAKCGLHAALLTGGLFALTAGVTSAGEHCPDRPPSATARDATPASVIDALDAPAEPVDIAPPLRIYEETMRALQAMAPTAAGPQPVAPVFVDASVAIAVVADAEVGSASVVAAEVGIPSVVAAEVGSASVLDAGMGSAAAVDAAMTSPGAAGAATESPGAAGPGVDSAAAADAEVGGAAAVDADVESATVDRATGVSASADQWAAVTPIGSPDVDPTSTRNERAIGTRAVELPRLPRLAPVDPLGRDGVPILDVDPDLEDDVHLDRHLRDSPGLRDAPVLTEVVVEPAEGVPTEGVVLPGTADSPAPCRWDRWDRWDLDDVDGLDGWVIDIHADGRVAIDVDLGDRATAAPTSGGWRTAHEASPVDALRLHRLPPGDGFPIIPEQPNGPGLAGGSALGSLADRHLMAMLAHDVSGLADVPAQRLGRE